MAVEADLRELGWSADAAQLDLDEPATIASLADQLRQRPPHLLVNDAAAFVGWEAATTASPRQGSMSWLPT